jgi:ABC-2 type transport system ATP-binding protein
LDLWCLEYLQILVAAYNLRLFRLIRFIIESREKDELIAAYRVVKGTRDELNILAPSLIASKVHAFGFTGLIKSEDLIGKESFVSELPSLEDIMIYYAKKEEEHEKPAV